jgi:hypothetical protein
MPGILFFFDDADRYRFYLYLQYAVEKFGCRIHSFCLMTNHIHLVVQTDAVPLSRIMQNTPVTPCCGPCRPAASRSKADLGLDSSKE